MKSALIGYTGFVGANLARQGSFDDQYNSKNIQDIDGKSYDLVVSAGARAEKWRINQDPETDLADLQKLKDHLLAVKTRKLVLISTVDVYKNPIGVDEDTKIDTDGLQPYGLHRYQLEQFCQENFDCLVVRLPGLFGQGLKKNVIYDFLHDNNIDKIHRGGMFQYYNLDNIWKDIQIALSNNLRLVNFAAEPVRTDAIAKAAFDMDFINEPEGTTAGLYDMKSKHADLFGGKDGYLYDKDQTLADITAFVAAEKTN